MASSNSIVPKVYYATETTALAWFNSKKDAMQWYHNVMKTVHPLSLLVADRHSDPRAMILRINLGSINAGWKITKILSDAGIICHNAPQIYSQEAVLANLSRIYKIGDSDYQILKSIGQGCYGDVYLARELNSQNLTVIKVLRHEDDNEHQMLERMQNRGGHRNIVDYYGSAKIDGKTWIAMEYINGVARSLYEIRHRWTLELREQYNDALAFMHQAGVDTWRENESENTLIIESEGKAVLKLIDFGTLARS